MIGILLSLILMPIILGLAGLVGYFVGVLIALIPGATELLASGLGLGNEAIPTILAWIFIFLVARSWFANNAE